LIPDLITQTWRDRSLPEAARPFAESWRRHNPQMQYRLFDDEACEALMADAFPEHLDLYRRLPFPVMRADVFRYAVIYRDGGVYADIDMECLRPIAPLLQGRAAVVATEAHITATRQRELGYALPLQIANCIFAARPGTVFFRAAVNHAMALCAGRATIGREDVEDLTGPRMLTRLFYERAWPEITVLRQIALMAPRHYPALWPLNSRMHGRHHFFGEWKRPTNRPLSRVLIERDLWPNPFPLDLVDATVKAPPQGQH
jgi:hypothetical protein